MYSSSICNDRKKTLNLTEAYWLKPCPRVWSHDREWVENLNNKACPNRNMSSWPPIAKWWTMKHIDNEMTWYMDSENSLNAISIHSIGRAIVRVIWVAVPLHCRSYIQSKVTWLEVAVRYSWALDYVIEKLLDLIKTFSPRGSRNVLATTWTERRQQNLSDYHKLNEDWVKEETMVYQRPTAPWLNWVRLSQS